MKRCLWHLLLFFFLCAGNNLKAQVPCNNAVNIAGLPYASPNHTTPTILTPNNGFSTCGAGNELNPFALCGVAGINGEDAVYTFTPATNSSCVNITLSGSGIGATPNLINGAALFIFNDCPTTVGTKCVVSSINNGGVSIQLNNLILDPGVTYYMVVDGGTACYPYRLSIANGNCATAPPGGGPGSNCTSAVNITFPYSANATTSGKGIDFTGGCVLPNNGGEDTYYHFTLTNTRCLHYQVTNVSAGASVYITQGCPGTGACLRSKSCRTPFCEGIVEEITLPPGDYYLVVKSDSPYRGVNYSIAIESLTADDDIICQTCNDSDNCAPCKNSGFEKMNLQNWIGAYGTYNVPGTTPGFFTGGMDDGMTRHTLVSRGHFDTLVPALSVVPPNGGDYAVRLGNCNNGYQAEQISYSVVVDSSNTNFIYQYAVVFEDPNHNQGNQPYFSIRMNVDGENISCAEYEVRPKPGLEGFKDGGLSPGNPGTAPGSIAQAAQSPIYYKDWTTVNIPLLDFIGKTATITFVTKDCNQGGHFGYAYIDAKCERLEILRDNNLYCKEDTIELKAPGGFVSYQWNTGAVTQSIKVAKKGTYSVTCTTVTGCVLVLSNEVKMELPPIPNFNWSFNCKDSTVTFTDASILQGTSPITRWEWSFGDGDSAFIQNPVHKYDSSGNFKVTLHLYTEIGCTGDTLIVLPIDVFMPPGTPNALDTIRLCEKETLQLKADSISQSVYAWTGPNNFNSSQRNPVKPNIAPADSGWYRLAVVIKDCLTKLDSTFVIIEPLKMPFIAPDTILCPGDTANLYCGGGGTYLWSPSKGLSSVTISNPLAYPDTTTRYAVKINYDLCPDTTLYVKVNVLSGKVSLQMPDTLRACLNGAVTLSGSTNGFDQFSWIGPNGFRSNKAAPVISGLNPAKVGYYFVDCSISNNQCSTGRDSVWVDFWPDPVVLASPDTTMLCVGDSARLNASGAQTYQWSPTTALSNSSIANPMVKPVSSMRYVVVGTDAHGCKGKDSVYVKVNPLPLPNLGNDLQLCLGDTGYVVFPNSFDSILWSDGTISDSVRITATGQLYINVWEKGCKGSDTIRFIFQDPGTFSLGPDTLLCVGASYFTNINLKADSVRWNDNVKTLNRTISTGGIYSVQIWSGKCEYTDTIIVSFDNPPAVNLIPDSIICKGDSVVLHAFHANAIRYSWNNGSTDSVLVVKSEGRYTVQLFSARCMVSDSTFITVVTPPDLNLGPDKNICNGDSAKVEANVVGGNVYTWNTGDTVPALWIKTTGIYDLTVVYGPCVLKDTVQVNVQFPAPFTLSSDTVLCEDQPLTVFGPNGYDAYLWNSGETSKDISPKQSGEYILAATIGLCTSVDTIKVQIDTVPEFQFLPPGPKLCEGSSVVVSAPFEADGYLWSTGDTTRSIEISKQGYYGLIITNGKCKAQDSLYLTVVVPPPVEIGPDREVCIGNGATYGDSVPLASYKWNTGETTAFITKYEESSYSVKVFFDVCIIKDTAKLTVSLKPHPDLGPDQLVCENAVFPLFANTFGETFNWNTNSTTDHAVVNQPGTYWVEVTNGSCIESDTVLITFQPKHRVILPPDVAFCAGDKFNVVSITDAKDPKYLWNTGAVTSSITIRREGNFILSVTDGPCVVSDTMKVVVNALPQVAPIELNICPEDSFIVHLPRQYSYFYSWNMTPFNDSVIHPRQQINLTVTDSNGCKWETWIASHLDMDCERDIYVPNTFTPNGDGDNEFFSVVAFNMQLLELEIFDRWGELIFSTTDPAKGWDGRYKGELCKTDVYEWKLLYINNYDVRKVKFGHVNLLK